MAKKKDIVEIPKPFLEFMLYERLSTLELRIIMLLLIENRPMTNTQIAAELEMVRQNTSVCVNSLERRGVLIEDRKEGRNRYFKLNKRIDYLRIKGQLTLFN